MSDKKIPLILVLEDFKKSLSNDINAGLSKGLPAYLLEDALNGYLADLRKIKNEELSAAYKSMEQEKKDGE